MTPENGTCTSEFVFYSNREESTLKFGKSISRFVFPGLLILLFGELGTGKTVLARGIVEGLAGKNVRSPSFTLVNEYKAEIPVTHADLYRLSCCRFEDLGLEDALEEGRLVLIEWAQNWKEPPQGETWECFFEIPGTGQDSDVRLIRIRACGERASASLEEIRKQIAPK